MVGELALRRVACGFGPWPQHMRIGFLINAIVGDGSICIYDLCRHGDKAGHVTRLYGKGFKDNRDGVTTVEFSDEEIRTLDWWKENPWMRRFSLWHRRI